MMYIHQPSLQQLKQDLAAFVRAAWGVQDPALGLDFRWAFAIQYIGGYLGRTPTGCAFFLTLPSRGRISQPQRGCLRYWEAVATAPGKPAPLFPGWGCGSHPAQSRAHYLRSGKSWVNGKSFLAVHKHKQG